MTLLIQIKQLHIRFNNIITQFNFQIFIDEVEVAIKNYLFFNTLK